MYRSSLVAPHLASEPEEGLWGVGLETPQLSDASEIETFCVQVFPAVYDSAWYPHMLTQPDIFKLCIRFKGAIIGLIVGRTDKREVFGASIRAWEGCEPSRRDDSFSSIVSYIMLLGVHQRFRGLHLGSRMLSAFLDSLEDSLGKQMEVPSHCVYLHVATDNVAAIEMYERRGFRRLRLMRAYYNYAKDHLPEDMHDAYLYVKHNAGGWRWSGILRQTAASAVSLIHKTINVCLIPIDLLLYHAKRLILPQFSLILSPEPTTN